MIPERWKSITDHYQMAKNEGASLHHSMVGDCIQEIKRLEELVKRPTNNCDCGNPINHDYCTRCLRQWES